MENNMISSFSERLKELRAEKGIRSEDAAEVFGVSRATLSAYEMGKSVPDLNVLNKMADFYGVSTDYICGRTNVKKSLQADTSSVKLSQRRQQNLRTVRQRNGRTFAADKQRTVQENGQGAGGLLYFGILP